MFFSFTETCLLVCSLVIKILVIISEKRSEVKHAALATTAQSVLLRAPTDLLVRCCSCSWRPFQHECEYLIDYLRDFILFSCALGY